MAPLVKLLSSLYLCYISALKYVPKDQLKTFQETNHAWLYLSDVYKEITENVRVTVIPFYMGIQESYNKFWVGYRLGP